MNQRWIVAQTTCIGVDPRDGQTQRECAEGDEHDDDGAIVQTRIGRRRRDVGTAVGQNLTRLDSRCGFAGPCITNERNVRYQAGRNGYYGCIEQEQPQERRTARWPGGRLWLFFRFTFYRGAAPLRRHFYLTLGL